MQVLPAPQHIPTQRPREYPTDTTSEEWEKLSLIIPPGQDPYHGGRKVQHSRRDIFDAIRYQLSTKCGWMHLPPCFPPGELVYHYYRLWRRNGVLATAMPGTKLPHRSYHRKHNTYDV